jgi:hypothetical protein
MKWILTLILAFCGPWASAERDHDQSNASHVTCDKLLRKNVNRWKAQLVQALSQISPHPIWPMFIDKRAQAMISTALNIKPGEVDQLDQHSLRLSLEEGRMNLSLDNWPRFQRALVSMRAPQVIKDFSLARDTFTPADQDSFELSLQSNTRLFFMIKDFGHNTQLGVLMPIREIYQGEYGRPPYFEFQLALLKPCLPEEPQVWEEEKFSDENGNGFCVDELVNFSTWNEEP